MCAECTLHVSMVNMAPTHLILCFTVWKEMAKGMIMIMTGDMVGRQQVIMTGDVFITVLIYRASTILYMYTCTTYKVGILTCNKAA